ncbi:hypothetical protein AB4238_22230 [Shewanella sp. 10N.286.45.A1]|uniref:hypothetical protein n=1 Tax=Shewanella sp. 10N.286.45.A1 TaxID=3229694 RepID=UPI0035506B8E
MSALIDFEAGKLAELFEQSDDLSIYMFMEKMNSPIDAQSTLISEISSLSHREHSSIAKVIESHGQSALSGRLIPIALKV